MSEQRHSDRDHLLSDILAESSEAGGRRGALLERTLRHVRRRRAVRQVRRAGLVLMPFAALVLLLWREPTPQPEPVKVNAPYILVRTEPLPQSAVIETVPFGASSLLATASSSKVATISTRPENPIYREIDDAMLLALAGTNPAVLVRLGPHSAELVFASEATASRRPE